MNSKIQQKYFQGVNKEWKTVIFNIFNENKLNTLEDLEIEYQKHSIYPQANAIFKCFSFF